MSEFRLSTELMKTDYHNDSRYKRYEADINKNLSTFETISEWADFIAFLSRLNKVSNSPKHTRFYSLYSFEKKTLLSFIYY